MSIYHSTTSGQQSNSPSSGTTNGQSAVDSTGKTDLTLDYLASVFASNGTIPPTMLPQYSPTSNLTSSTEDIINAIIAAATAAATTTNNTTSANSIDPFTASVLLSPLMYSHQQQQQSPLVPSSPRQPPTDLYCPKSSLSLDPILFAQHALMQADFDASARQHQQNPQYQQQMALAMANLIGQYNSNPLLPMQHRRDLYGVEEAKVVEAPTAASASVRTDESFSSVLAKLTHGLNQGSGVSALSSGSSRAPRTSQSQTKDLLAPSSSAASASSCGTLNSTSRFAFQGVGENVTALTTATAAALTALQQQQSRLAASKQSSQLPYRSAALASTSRRDGQPHRGRGRPPKSSFIVNKVIADASFQSVKVQAPIDKSSQATSSIPLSESSLANSNSIDGTITDVLKRLNNSVDQSGSRKRRRVDYTSRITSSAVSTPESVTNTTTSSGGPIFVSKSDTFNHKRTRTFADSGYRLPLGLGWRRETLVKGVGPGGLLGDVVYITPCGRQFWNIEGIREYIRSTGNSVLTTEDFTFKSYIRLGDYYECNKDSKGFVKMSDNAVNALITTGHESPSGSHRPTPQVFPSTPTSPSSTTTSTSVANAAGVTFTPDLMAGMATTSAESYSKSFTEFPLDLPRFPSLPPQLTSVLANQIGSLWPQWPTGIPCTVASAMRASSPSTSSSTFAFSPTQQQDQQLKDRFPFQFSSLRNSEDYDRFRAFFTKLVEYRQRLEVEKATQRKADLEAQTAKARDERIAHLMDEEMRRSVEDLNLLNPKALPTFDHIDGNKMPSQLFADCVFVLEFLHAFTEVLCIDPETIPSMQCMQAAFIDRDKTCIEVINHLIIELLKFAILDPGIPTPRLVTQLLSQRFSEMEVNTHTVTGLLRVFLIGRNGYEDEMSDWLMPSTVDHLTNLPGPQLASLLVFICDQLACSSRIIPNEVDRTIELQISLRRDKFSIEAKIRKIRVILARKFGLDHTVKSKEWEDENCKKQPAFLQNMRQLASFQNYDSGDEDELNDVEELEKRIEMLYHCLEAKQRAIEECSFRLSGVFLGQDRFHRSYFVLGSIGGIYVEGQPTTVREGSAVREVPLVFDADAIVAEIKARKELSVKRNFITIPSITSNSTALVQKPNGLRSMSNSSSSTTMKIEKPTTETEKEEEAKLVKSESNSEELCKDQIEGEPMEIAHLISEHPQKGTGKMEEIKTRDDNQHCGDPTVEKFSEEEVGTPKVEERSSKKKEDSEELTTWQPLDLSKKRISPPSTPLPPQDSDLTIWQSLTEQDLASALDGCKLDETFLTTATLLFAAQTDTMDHCTIMGSWTDPGWQVQLLFYKLQLVRSIAFERRKHCENDENSLSTALGQLKTWLTESGLGNGEEVHHLNASSSGDVKLEEEELTSEVERTLKERGVQEAGSETLESIPLDAKGDWWRVKGLEKLQMLLEALHPRGIRERSLAQAIQVAEEVVTSSIHADASAVLDLASASNSQNDSWKPRLLRVRSRRGKGRGANASGLVGSTTSLAAFGSGRQFTSTTTSSSVMHSASITNLFDAASCDADAFRADVDTSLGSTMERSVFLGENFERAMRAGRNSLNLTSALTAAEREFLDEFRFLELVEGLVDRVLSASLQTKGWQAPMKATEDDSIQIVPRDTPKVYRYDYRPLELARERLLDLEAHTERRYLLPPLSCESRLDVVQAQAAAAVEEETVVTLESGGGAGSGSVCSDSTTHEEVTAALHTHTPPHIRRRLLRRGDGEAESEEGDCIAGSGGAEGTSGETQGLLQWRRSTRKADSVADLKRCAMQFEAAIAWDKSIMKVLCQICRRDKNEARLLLCDGCDHGYHTYCFRPSMISIPEGDWFCYDCVSKATSKCHCFVCGLARPMSGTEARTPASVEPAHRLAQCVSCSRGAHPACLRPPLNRLPKRWTCMLCAASGSTSAPVAKVTSAAAAATVATVSESNSPKKAQANASPTGRPKRVYVKSGAYRSSKRMTKSKSESVKRKTAKQRKVGRPKGGNSSVSAIGAGSSSKRKQSTTFKKRGRPQGFYKHSELGDENEADDGDDEDVEDAKAKGEEDGGEERELEASGDEEECDNLRSVIAANGISSSRKSAAPRRHARSRESSLSLTERDFCRHAIEDLMKHELSWPFRRPVCSKTVPIYRKVIKRPMDLSTILKRLSAERWNYYTSVLQWREDVRQIFKNCRFFNEDDSEIGKAGHELRRYFEIHWAHFSHLLNCESAPSGENSVVTAPSSPDCRESSTRAPSPAVKPVCKMDEILPLPPPEFIESADLRVEVEDVLGSSCARETVAESFII